MRTERLRTFAGAARAARDALKEERLPRDELRARQQERLDALVRHAVAHSAGWRERLGDAATKRSVDLASLPVLTKSELMDGYDDLVTDRRLKRDDLLAHVEAIDGDDLYLGEHRVMTTSGSSGRKGLFVYDRDGWRAILAQFLRVTMTMGLTPKLPRRRFAAIVGAAPTHMSRRCAAGSDVGLHRTLSLAVTDPLDEIVATLNRFQPEFLGCYPSIAMRLAEERLAGRLRIELSAMGTSSELRTPETTERLVEAFGVHPYDLYATTEGVWGMECERHHGFHLFEDNAIVEVDGDRILVTNLRNRVQPIIRMEVSDRVVLDPEPCPCGRTTVLTKAMEGRTDDVLTLPGRDGEDVAVQPMQFAVVTRDRDVREFQVVQQGDALRLLVVPRDGANGDLEERLRATVGAQLAALGVREPRVAVERRAELERSPGGKLQVVVADRPR
jgi:phenylacetate-coenzyme A ligase PaaK-like adenylate-forming protein